MLPPGRARGLAAPIAPSSAAAPARLLARLLGRTATAAPPAPPPAWAFLEQRFDVVHAFRLAMLPYAAPYWGRAPDGPARHLDLDDVESTTRGRIAALLRDHGEEARARHEEGEAASARRDEGAALAELDRVYVCSEADRLALAPRARAELCVLPNALPAPITTPAPPPR